MIRDFRPINPHGKAAEAPKRPLLEPLYQVHVDTREGERIPVGPRIGKSIAERFRMAIDMQITRGLLSDWSNPTLVRVQSH